MFGYVDEKEMVGTRLCKHRYRKEPHGVMTVTTDNLHKERLAVDAHLVRSLRVSMSLNQAKDGVKTAGLVADIPPNNSPSILKN